MLTRGNQCKKPSGVAWISQLPKLNDTVIEYNDEYQRCRLRALQSIDEMVEGIVKRLDAAGQLDNTYIFYTTDNGYHISQHRMHPGKECGFETDINIPLIVRGPGVARGVKSAAVTAHSDLTPTFLKIVGAPPRSGVDGSVMPLHAGDRAKSEHVNIEFWGNAAGEGKYGSAGSGASATAPSTGTTTTRTRATAAAIPGRCCNPLWLVLQGL